MCTSRQSMHVHMSVHTHPCKYMHAHTSIYTYTYIYTCIFMYYTCMHAHSHSCTHIHMHTHNPFMPAWSLTWIFGLCFKSPLLLVIWKFLPLPNFLPQEWTFLLQGAFNHVWNNFCSLIKHIKSLKLACLLPSVWSIISDCVVNFF